MTSYITALNAMIVEAAARIPNVFLYGENISTGSKISGLTKGLRTDRGGRIVNIGNCEATHCGLGFGLMMNGASAVLFVKQLDFMLLGVDHFVSTYNVIRSDRDRPVRGSFSIVTMVCDQGRQGPQSSFNALTDLCSLARVPGYALTNSADAAAVLGSQLGAPGFRFIALSQRLFPTELLQLEADSVARDQAILRYRAGADATIVCFNFSLPEGLSFADRLAQTGRSSSLFSVNPVFPVDWTPIVADVRRTGRLVVLDDTKGALSMGYELLEATAAAVPMSRRVMGRRPPTIPFGVDDERFDADYAGMTSTVFAPS